MSEFLTVEIDFKIFSDNHDVILTSVILSRVDYNCSFVLFTDYAFWTITDDEPAQLHRYSVCVQGTPSRYSTEDGLNLLTCAEQVTWYNGINS